MQYTCNIGLNTGQSHTHMYGFSTPFTMLCCLWNCNGFNKPVVIGNLGTVWCDGVSGEWFTSFQRIIVPSSSIVKAFFDCLILSDEGTMILKKFRNLSPSDPESHPRRPDPQQHCCKNKKSSSLLLIQCCMWKLKEAEHGGDVRMVIIWVLITCWWLSTFLGRLLLSFSVCNCYLHPLMEVVSVSEILVAKSQSTCCQNPVLKVDNGSQMTVCILIYVLLSEAETDNDLV
jgi:hypothetical protein